MTTPRTSRPIHSVKTQERMEDYLAEGRDKLKVAYPEVWGKLDLAIERLKTATQAEDYQAVGLLCRDAMILFANAIFSPDFVPAGEDVPGPDKVQQRIELTLSHFGELGGSERLRRLVKAVFSYAQGLQHNREAGLGEARRTLLFTTAALIELTALIETATKNEQWVQKYGVYKCGGCGSTQLVEELCGDYDGPGPSFLICQKCNWQAIE